MTRSGGTVAAPSSTSGLSSPLLIAGKWIRSVFVFLISFIILSKTNAQVRVGEWKVVDTNSFDRKKCAYYDSKTKTQCEGARFCRKRCSLENAKIDCIPSSRGQEKCSDEVQVQSNLYPVSLSNQKCIVGY